MDGAPLGVLGYDVDILKLAVNRIAGENRIRAAQIVGDIHRLGRHANGVGGGQP